jgi:pimeloyl-ACP methyl ester carboxylesterase
MLHAEMYQADALPRRRFLGLQASDQTPERPGEVVVTGVLAGGAAAGAGVEPGDVVVAINDHPVGGVGRLQELARAVRNPAVAFRLRRGDLAITCSANAPPLPLENVPGGSAVLGHVLVGDHKLRTIAVVPHGAGPHPAVLYLQGVRATSCEFPLHGEHPVAKLAHGLVLAGFLVLRVERSGVGDSEGPGPSQTDLGAELDMYDAALDHLLSRSDVDPSRVFLFGHSFGGMLAPLLALDRPLRGVVVLGASARRWHDCVVGVSERRLGLLGAPPPLVRKTVLWNELHRLVCRESWMPAQALDRFPHLRELRSRDCVGDTLYGRHAAVFQQLDAIDLSAAWRDLGAARTRVLSLRGTYDWLCDPQDGPAIVSVAGEGATHVEIDRLGHDLLVHDSIEASALRPNDGVWDRRLLDATSSWMKSRWVTR